MDIATLGLRVDGTGAIRTVDAFTASTARAAVSGGAAERSAMRLKSAFLKLAGFLGAGALFRAVISNTSEAQDAFAQLEAGVKSTGGAAGFTARQLETMAGSLQSLTAYEDEAIEGAQALLLTFNNIRGDMFKDATSSVLDLAQRMGGDLRGAAIQVGKALQDPIKGMLALRRSGVSFSTSQQQVIKDLVNTGRLAEAQRMILKELELEFGGSAAAARNTLGGALKGLKHAFGDLLEVSPSGTSGIVAFLHDLEKLLVKIKSDVLPQVGLVFLWLWNIIKSGVRLWQDLPQGVKTTILVFGTLALVVPKLASLIVFLTGVVLKLAAAFRAVAAAESLAAMLSPTGWLILGLTAVAAAFGYLGYKALQAANDARKAAEEFRAALGLMNDAALSATSGSLVTQWAVVDKALEEHKETLRALQSLSGAQQGGPRMPESPAYQQRAADWLRRKLGIHAGEQQSQVAGLIRSETETVQALEAQQALLLERGTMAAEEVRRRREAAQQLDVPFTDVSTHADNSDAIAKQLAANAAMVAAARQGVELAAEQGMAQQRLGIEYDAVNKAMEARANVETRAVLPATLAAIDAERRLKLEALDVSALREQTQAREDAARTQQQSVALSGVEGAAQTRLRIEYDALNKAIEANRNLRGAAPAILDRTMEDIDTERDARLMEERARIVKTYREGVRDEFRGLFEDIQNNGLSAFGNLFATVRRMFTRLVADMAAKQFMAKIGNRWGESLAVAFGGANSLKTTGPERAAVALTGSAGALSAAAAALSAAAGRLGAPTPPYRTAEDAVRDVATAERYGGAAAQAAKRPPALALEGVTAVATRRSTEQAAERSAQTAAKAIAKYVGPAIAGFFAGSAIGSMTTNRAAGAFGGAAAGAASGFAMGGPLGAAIGGLAGAVGGFLGASKKRAEEERALREVLQRNGERLKELSENISGLSLMAGKNLAAGTSLAGGLVDLKKFGGFFGGMAANAFGGVSTKELAAALKGGESSKRLKQYEQQFGITVQDLGRMAKQLGIELFDSAGKLIPAALEQLRQALELTVKAATTFTGSMEDQKSRQEAYNRLFDIPDTAAQRLKDSYALLEKGAPDLLKQLGLANLNLDTDAGRNVLLSGLQDIFKLIDAGMLTPELLGAFKDKDGLIAALLSAKDGLDAFKGALSTATTDFPRAMDLILYEQRYGKSTGAAPGTTGPKAPPPMPPDTNPGGASPGRQPITFTGPIIIESYGGESDEIVASRFERATKNLAFRGGFTVTGGATT